MEPPRQHVLQKAPEQFEGFQVHVPPRLRGGLSGDRFDGLEMEEVLMGLLGAELIGRTIEMFTELPDTGEVGLLVAGPDGQELQVLGEGMEGGVALTGFASLVRPQTLIPSSGAFRVWRLPTRHPLWSCSASAASHFYSDHDRRGDRWRDTI